MKWWKISRFWSELCPSLYHKCLKWWKIFHSPSIGSTGRLKADKEAHVVHCRKASREVTYPLRNSEEDLSADLNKEVFTTLKPSLILQRASWVTLFSSCMPLLILYCSLMRKERKDTQARGSAGVAFYSIPVAPKSVSVENGES